ncbi:MAG: GtrA family protein, partial [Clostridia bacterium]
VKDREAFFALVVQFIKFGVVGLSNTLISLTVYYLLVWLSPSLYMWGNVLGWVLSVLNAFYWSNKVVFQSQSNTKAELWRRLAKCYVSYGGTFLLSTALLYAEVQWWGVSEWLAPIVNLLLTIPLNFLINKLWTFRK